MSTAGRDGLEGDLTADFELRIAIKTAADTAEIRGYEQINGLLVVAFRTLDDVIAKKECALNQYQDESPSGNEASRMVRVDTLVKR